MVTSKTPKLDLHGEEKALVYALVMEFINDNSTNILTREVHSVLKECNLVKKYYLNNWNLGETIIELI